jgi:hypothetical protein
MHPFQHDFIVAEHDSRLHRVIKVSGGKLTHEFKIEWPLDLQSLPDGHVLLSANRAIVELDANFREVWRYDQKRAAIFSCQKRPDGNILFGDASRAAICEVNPAKRIVRQFDFPLVAEPHEYLHAFRLIRATDNDGVLIAAHDAKKLIGCDWAGAIVWQADLPGTPYMPIQLPGGNILVSLGPSGLIVEVNRAGQIVWQYDMTADNQLPRGWIAGMSVLPDGHIVYSDSTYDRLVEIDRDHNLVALYEDRNILLHPSTHIIL